MISIHRLHVVLAVTLCAVLLWKRAEAAATPAPIDILTPAGGEFFVVGTQQKVRLNPKTRSKSVTIELSTDNGASFPTVLGTINNLDKDKTKRNVLPFTVPNLPSGQCVIRALGVEGGSGRSGAFSIGSGGVPNGQDFVKITGDTMTGALTVANKVTVSDATTSTVALAGGSTDSHSFISDSNGLRLERAVPGQARTFMNLTGSNNDFSVGFGGQVICRGNGSVAIDGAFTLEATTLTGDFNANNATCVFFCNTTNGNIEVTLPTPSAAGSGRFYVFKKIVLANTLTITPPAGSSIDGVAAGISLTANNAFRIIMSSGSNWFVISQ